MKKIMIDWTKDVCIEVKMVKTICNPTSVKVTDMNGNVTILKPLSKDFINDAPLTC